MSSKCQFQRQQSSDNKVVIILNIIYILRALLTVGVLLVLVLRPASWSWNIGLDLAEMLRSEVVVNVTTGPANNGSRKPVF